MSEPSVEIVSMPASALNGGGSSVAKNAEGLPRGQGASLKQALLAACCIVLCAAPAAAQQRTLEIAPGFRLQPGGVLAIGGITAEVFHYDGAWVVSQQHDRFEPNAVAWSPARAEGPAAATRARVLTGVLRTNHGPGRLQERVQPLDGGIRYSATLTHTPPLPTNELSLAFLLPVASHAASEIRVDGRAVRLPAPARPRGRAVILELPGARAVEVPTARGTLVVTGRFRFLVQDDREWGDERYSMRLFFTPGSGSITRSDIDLRLRLDRSRRAGR